MSNNYTPPSEINKTLVNSTTSLRKETSMSIALSDSQISYTLADRTDVDSKYSHYFSTFNIPHVNSNSVFYSGDTMATFNPALYQLNVDKIAVIPISENFYSEYIDGRSITLKVPQWGGTYKKIISSFYSDKYKTTKIADSPIKYFGPDNVAFLFSDDVNKPYTGTTESGAVNHYQITTWDSTNDFHDRPSAVAYNPEVTTIDYNTDLRPWSSVKLAVSVPQDYPTSSGAVANGYNFDIPVGFVCLDRGFIVLTHPQIVDNIPWTSGSTIYETGYADVYPGINVINGSNAGPTSGTSRIVFTGITSTLSFEDISIRYLNSIVCIAMPAQFFISTNPTWPLNRNIAERNNGTTNYDSIFVTQIGLYNAYSQLIAVAKLDRPIEKTYDSIVSFNLEIDI